MATLPGTAYDTLGHHLIYDIGTKDGLLHVFLIGLDDTLDVVDNLLDFRR